MFNYYGNDTMSWMGNNHLNTQRLTLRPIQETDLENVYKGLSNPEVIKHYGVSFSTLEETKEQMQWYQELVENETGFWWAIELSESGKFVGAVGLNDIKIEHRRGEIGFWLLPEFWGNGYVTEAAFKVLAVGFKDFNLHRIEAWVESGNTGSEQVLKRLGFTHEGSFKDYEIKNSQLISVDIFARFVDNPV